MQKVWKQNAPIKNSFPRPKISIYKSIYNFVGMPYKDHQSTKLDDINSSLEKYH